LATSTRLARSSRNGGSTRTSTPRTRLNGLTPSEYTTKKRGRGSRRTSIQKEFAHCANDQDERQSGNQQLPVHHCNSLSNHRNQTVQRQTPKLKRSRRPRGPDGYWAYGRPRMGKSSFPKRSRPRRKRDLGLQFIPTFASVVTKTYVSWQLWRLDGR
jgi:hypothetical protein